MGGQTVFSSNDVLTYETVFLQFTFGCEVSKRAQTVLSGLVGILQKYTTQVNLFNKYIFLSSDLR